MTLNTFVGKVNCRNIASVWNGSIDFRLWQVVQIRFLPKAVDVDQMQAEYCFLWCVNTNSSCGEIQYQICFECICICDPNKKQGFTACNL
jgi:hypothetical protein